MTHAEEANLYIRDHAAWCAYIAPRWREMLMAAMPERKRELWDMASFGLRTELNKLKLEQAA